MKNLLLLVVLLASSSIFAHSDYCYKKLRWPVVFLIVEIQKQKYQVVRKTLGKVRGTISRNDYTKITLNFH